MSSESLDREIQDLLHTLRLGQRAMAEWQGGELAVSAVPGSGKSTGMAAAAAIVIARQRLNAQRYLVVVTFTRSAALNIKGKIRHNLQRLGLPPTGFWVSTLHGLALQIATRHGGASGIDWDNITLMDPNRNHRLVQTTVDQWITEHPYLMQHLLRGQQFDGEETERLRRQSALRTEILPDLMQTVVQEAKSSGLRPEDLARLSDRLSGKDGVDTDLEQDCPGEYPILTIAAGLYDRYQQNLRTRGLMDYDDMILAALRVLESPTLRQFWQRQVFAVFEDEAQDSSPLQTRLLEILAGESSDPSLNAPLNVPLNLIRVGDPNQAINSTFTPADPTFFRQFCQRCHAQGRLVEMDQAGRSTPIVMVAANQLVDWVNQQAELALSHQTLQARRDNSQENFQENSSNNSRVLPFRPQPIRPVDPGDPQPNANPDPVGRGVEILRPATIEETVTAIRDRIRTIVRGDGDFQGAILVRENRQGKFLAERLQDLETELGLSIYEVGEQERHSHVPQEMLTLLQFMQRPHSPDYLKAALKVLSDRQFIPAQDFNRLAAYPELFLYPTALEPQPPESVRQAQRFCTQLLRARMELPPTDLIAFLGLSLQYDQTELATADKLADYCSQRLVDDLSLPGMVATLQDLLNTEKFEGVDPQAMESRYTASKQVTIITMHKAKGLDWNYVFLPFLQQQSIPGSTWIPNSAQFLGNFTLSAVTRSYLRQMVHSGLLATPQSPNPTLAWEEAQSLKRSEEYRLLYVAMTRAKRLLWMAAEQQAPFSWSKPEQLQDSKPCPVIPYLQQLFGLPT